MYNKRGVPMVLSCHEPPKEMPPGCGDPFEPPLAFSMLDVSCSIHRIHNIPQGENALRYLLENIHGSLALGTSHSAMSNTAPITNAVTRMSPINLKPRQLLYFPYIRWHGIAVSSPDSQHCKPPHI
jgi:hypothetical protein